MQGLRRRLLYEAGTRAGAHEERLQTELLERRREQLAGRAAQELRHRFVFAFFSQFSTQPRSRDLASPPIAPWGAKAPEPPVLPPTPTSASIVASDLANLTKLTSTLVPVSYTVLVLTLGFAHSQ
ncbi:unnamed protein product [Heligmosomoides polygyrus]|uniref:Uncharacterized protein n=1 Tax=Heligmosomoides polygyrus TaxID=6339 RepID=A0A183G7F7_HELPZ|nr:unnamed protein product [Heligmosomoides polygyrus]